MIKIFFEHYKIPQFYVAIDAVLSLFASGRTTGCVVDSGYGTTHVVPVYEGYHLPHAVQTNKLSGYELTKYLDELFKE